MKTKRRFLLLSWLAVNLTASGAMAAESSQSNANPNRFFGIHVVDKVTGRGVPLVQLKAVSEAVWWTDSGGWVAFDEPGLMGQEIFLHVSSPGYEYPRDYFGNHGVKVRPQPGQRTEIKLQRTQIAERLYRITGEGIYRDSVFLQLPTPTRNPVLNGLVAGQDTVIATRYRGKIFWFWGDTERVGYPLGNFGASGATSEEPGHGGLPPNVGIDLKYFVGADGFSKPMCPESEFGAGLKWIEGIMTVRDERGQEKLVARVAAGTGLQGTREWRLGVFNDAREIFESVTRWDVHDGHDSSHAFQARVGDVPYLYLYPDFRVRADLSTLRDWRSYEAFTCVAGDGRLHGKDTVIERDGGGLVRYGWKAGADRLHAGRLHELERADLLKPSERWLQLRDVETDRAVEGGRGSVFWNHHRRRWIAITSGQPGEIWFSEGDTPVGPWVYARRVATHGRYNFYNPTQHPFFDEAAGRLIYFEGTYTASFSGAPAKTPRYDYNQIMYRLDLDDPRLALPAPVYCLRSQSAEDGKGPLSRRCQLRETIAAQRAWDRIEHLAFFAIPPERANRTFIPVYEAKQGEGWQTNAPMATARPVFYAMPEMGTNNPAATVSLSDLAPAPPCRVWRSPVATVILDASIVNAD